MQIVIQSRHNAVGQSRFAVLLLAALFFITAFASQLQAAPSEGATRSIINGAASVVLKAAWPTAIYESWDYHGTEIKWGGKVDVTFRIHARSYWNGGPLWVDVVARINSDLEVEDVQWGRHKGFMPPGGAYKAVAYLAK